MTNTDKETLTEVGAALEAIVGTGAIELSRLRRDAETYASLKRWLGRALATTHLVDVAALLKGRLGSTDDFEALGMPVDILACFPDWERGSRTGFHPRRSDLGPAPHGAGEPLGSLRLQLSPDSFTADLSLILLRDLLRRTDPSVAIYIMVQPGANLEGLQELARTFHPDADRRVILVEGETSTVFSQDNAMPIRDAEGRPVLLIPRQFLRGTNREGDELTPEAATRMFGVTSVRSSLFWEGGNVLCGGTRYLVGADTVAVNMSRLGLDEGEVIEIFTAELGAPVVVMGDLSAVQIEAGKGSVRTSGQASFHIDLDISLLGRFGRNRIPRALVADPVLGVELLDAVLTHRRLITGHFVPPKEARELIEAEYVACASERHPKLLAYAETLEGLGYRVVGVPDLRVTQSENLFNLVNLDFIYTNILTGLRRGQPSIFYLAYGLQELDRLAERCYRKAGAQPVRVSRNTQIANTLMQILGGLHCFCGRLS